MKILLIIISMLLPTLGFAKEVITVGVFQNTPIVSFEDDEAKGLYPNLLNYIADKENWDIEYKLCNLSDCLELIKQNKLDIMTSVGITPERKKYLVYSKEPIWTFWGIIYSMHEGIYGILDLEGHTVGVRRGNKITRDIKKILTQFKIDVEYVEYNTYEETFDAAHRGIVDVVAVNNIYDFKTNKQKAHKTPIVFNPFSAYFAVSKDSDKKYILHTIDAYVKKLRSQNKSLFTDFDKQIYDSSNQNTLTTEEIKLFLVCLFIIGGLLLMWRAYSMSLLNRKLKSSVIETEGERDKLQSLIDLHERRSLGEEELCEYVLEEAVRLTNSEIGYLHFVRDDEQTISLHMWSTHTMSMCTAEKLDHYPLSEAGIWADCVRQRRTVIHNDYNQAPNKKGLPEGHFPLDRHMSVPVFDRDKIVVIVGVGNKRSPYSLEDDSQLKLFLTSTWDIIKQKRYERDKVSMLDQLRESADRFRTLFENAPIAYQSLDIDGVFVEVNEAWLTELGYTKDEVLGNHVSEFLHKDSLATLEENFSKFKESGELININFNMKHKDGSYKLMVVNGKTGKHLNGSFKQTHCVLRDITQQNKLEQEQDRLNKQLRHTQKMDALGIMAGGIAHDFNNILSAVLGYAEMIRDNKKATEDIKEEAQTVLKAAHRAKDLVARILTFSKKDGYKRLPIQIKNIVEEALELITATTPTSTRICIGINKCGIILGEPTQIHQIVVNLCTNANTAMDDDGRLEVSLNNTVLTDTDLSDHPEMSPGSYVHLKVKDTGCGIPVEDIERIFDPYFTTKRKGKGSGMGLSVCLGIIKSHDAFITLQSKVGVGTTFNVYFPIIEEKVVEIKHEDIDNLPTGTETIMVVDDEELILDMTKQRLEQLGYNAVTFVDSVRALEVFTEYPNLYDLIITDHAMPNMTGKELITEVKKIKSDIPIILTSGYSSSLSDNPTKELGICGYAGKPVSVDEIALLIRGCLDKPSS